MVRASLLEATFVFAIDSVLAFIVSAGLKFDECCRECRA